MAGHAEGRASVERCGWIIPGISHTINERVNELERKSAPHLINVGRFLRYPEKYLTGVFLEAPRETSKN